MKATVLLLFVMLVSCSTPSKESVNDSESSSPPKQVISLLGEPLAPKSMTDSIRGVLEGNLERAKGSYEKHPDSLDLAIWQGRRIAYIGRYFEAIDFYTEAIEKFPNDHRLYRHRGHRYISTRQLDKAISDFGIATELAEQVPNQIEPDGIPNKLNTPLGNDRFNIYYHHALALYLQEKFEEAIPVYQKCMAVSDNPDLLVATSYWLYMALYRTGQTTKAKELLQPINREIEIVENEAYLQLLLNFKGELSKEETFTLPDHPTYQYGLWMQFFLNSEDEKALKNWTRLLEHDSWDAFGYIAAEAEVARTQRE